MLLWHADVTGWSDVLIGQAHTACHARLQLHIITSKDEQKGSPCGTSSRSGFVCKKDHDDIHLHVSGVGKHL